MTSRTRMITADISTRDTQRHATPTLQYVRTHHIMYVLTDPTPPFRDPKMALNWGSTSSEALFAAQTHAGSTDCLPQKLKSGAGFYEPSSVSVWLSPLGAWWWVLVHGI